MADQMIYRALPSTGDKLSIIGFGCMRLPRIAAAIDEAKTERLIALALERGVNYFDSAYLYPGSEKALGKALERLGARDRVKVSTKMPPMFVKNRRDMDDIFNKQLERLKSDYIDYYLIHNLSSFTDYEKQVAKGFTDFAARERERGRMRGVGFSFHGNLMEFKRIIDAYPWDICMVQYNYLDEYFQAGAEGVKYAAGKGVGVVTMESLRGGMLGDGLPADARKLFDNNLRRAGGGEQLETRGAVRPPLPSVTPAELALRWVWSHPYIVSALSGMGLEKHVEDNCRAVYALGGVNAGSAGAVVNASDAPNAAAVTGAANATSAISATGAASASAGVELFDSEKNAIAAIRGYYNKNLRVPCTACAYCLPCRAGVDIPTCFSWYNSHGIRKGMGAKMHYIMSTEGAVNNNPTKASLCNSCGACEPKCPQKIEIRARLKDVARVMESGFIRKPVIFGLRLMSKRIN